MQRKCEGDYFTMKSKIIVIVVLVSIFGGSFVFAWDLPEDVMKEVARRKGKTELSRVAESMKPGTWAELKTDAPKRLWSAPPPSKGLNIATWSDDAHWDSRTGQFLFFGVRQTRKFIAYSEEKNAWRVIPFHEKSNAPGLKQKYGHQYSNNSLDPVRSRYYTTTWQYDIVKDSWARLPRPFRTMTYEYFTAMDALVSLERERGNLAYLVHGAQKWTKVKKLEVHGYHSLARHNPFRKEVLLAGGNNCKAVVVLDKNGNVKQMKDFPLEGKLTVRSSIVTVDPLSGRYLFMVPGKKFVEFDSGKNQYRLADDFTETAWPIKKGQTPVVAFIPEYGVTIWANDNKQSMICLYKHDASADLKVLETDKEKK